MLLIKRRLFPFLTSAILCSSLANAAVLADFDGTQVSYEELAFRTPGVLAQQIADNGPTGSYYHLLDGGEGDAGNYLSFDAPSDTTGWKSVKFSMDYRVDRMSADGWSIAFLDIPTHGPTAAVRAGAGGFGDAEERGQFSNSIGIGFRTFNGTNAQVTYDGVESPDTPYDQQQGDWGSLEVTLEKNAAGDVLVGATLYPELGLLGVGRQVFNNYLLQDVSLEEFRVQIAGRTGGVSMDLDVDNIELDVSFVAEFQVIEGNFTWQEAKADAEAKGGRLAVLDTQEKIDAANTYLEELGEWPVMWIGLTDESEEGVWKWIDNTPLTAQNWENREPNNSFGGAPEHYAVISNSSRSRDKKWNDLPPGAGLDFAGNPTGAYLLEILDQAPAAPFVALDLLYESPSGETITLDATPTVGFPTEFTYQWCFNGFKIPANLGGTASSINIDNLQANEGTWSVRITNSEGIFEQDFEYRLYADSDSDGLSDGYEEVISKTDINNPDTDNDGLVDGDEVNTYSTNPNSTDSDSDGFTDLYELETAYNPNSAESVPDALVEIMTAIEVKFNAALGATYAIEFSTDYQAWDVIEDDIVGEGGAIERLYSKQEYPTGFFRVERKDQ